MNCKNCHKDISKDDIEVTVNSTDIEVVIFCPNCEEVYEVIITNADLTKC